MRRYSLLPLEESAPAASAVPAPDPSSAFAQLASLIALIVDAPACAGRVAELQAATEAAAKATAALDDKRARHAEAVARERAEAEKTGQALREREIKVYARELEVARSEESVRKREAAVDLREGRFRKHGDSGVVQEFYGEDRVNG